MDERRFARGGCICLIVLVGIALSAFLLEENAIFLFVCIGIGGLIVIASYNRGRGPFLRAAALFMTVIFAPMSTWAMRAIYYTNEQLPIYGGRSQILDILYLLVIPVTIASAIGFAIRAGRNDREQRRNAESRYNPRVLTFVLGVTALSLLILIRLAPIFLPRYPALGLSLYLISLIMSVVAVVTGALSRRHIKQTRSILKGRRFAEAGLIFGIGSCYLHIIIVLFAFLINLFVNSSLDTRPPLREFAWVCMLGLIVSAVILLISLFRSGNDAS